MHQRVLPTSPPASYVHTKQLRRSKRIYAFSVLYIGTSCMVILISILAPSPYTYDGIVVKNDEPLPPLATFAAA